MDLARTLATSNASASTHSPTMMAELGECVIANALTDRAFLPKLKAEEQKNGRP